MLNVRTGHRELELLSEVAHHPKGLVLRENGFFRKAHHNLARNRRIRASSEAGLSVWAANGLNSESDLWPDPTLSTTPEEQRRIDEQTLDRLVPNPEGSCQSMFQDLSFRVECLLSRWRDGNVSSLGKNQAKSLENFPGAQPALLWLPTLLDCQRVICAVVFDLEAQKLMDGDQCLRVFGDDQYLSALGRILGSVDDLIL